ncbi:NAD(P)H-binding protein [Marinomonas transparens]|uniref:NAD(P)H-binding protein n=1 Tax=Marinomonas transparens TaxID=2795388 RepID=A0A934N4S8_9GAMM|nr:NAD(P)H-binding protein [Marinomonas transparens]MBJ7536321.1 NAD(P)H-binding protein [Marinomonas transparens]
MMLITGTSGQLSSLIVAKAKELGLNFITASRSLNADRQMDFDHIETIDFTGVDTLFLTSAGYAEDDIVIRRHNNVITAASTQGVKHIVYTSLSYASDHLGFALAHRWTERRLQESGMAWTILRNGLYAELIGSLASSYEGRITAPFGNEEISAVSREDLADAAVAVLKDTIAHNNKVYELSGVKSFSVPDLAQRISVRYEPTDLSTERSRLETLQLLPFQVPMLMSIYASSMAGFLKTNSSDLTSLVPRPRDALATACTTATKET